MSWIDWATQKKQIIGAIVIITVLGVGTLYLTDIRGKLLFNPEQNLFVINQPDKNEINVIQRDGDSFNRYRITEDEICQYKGGTKLACYQWYLDYYRTYGEDQWVNGLWRKKSLIMLEVNETEERVYVKKITPYYAFNYGSGSDGRLIEKIIVYQDHTDFSIDYIPTRENNLHRLRMRVSSLKGNEIPFDFGDSTSIRFDDEHNFVFRWDGAGDFFDHHEVLESGDVMMFFKSQKGEIQLG